MVQTPSNKTGSKTFTISKPRSHPTLETFVGRGGGLETGPTPFSSRVGRGSARPTDFAAILMTVGLVKALDPPYGFPLFKQVFALSPM